MSLLHQIALSCIPGVGPVLARNLLSYCGNAEEVFRFKKKQLSRIPGVGAKITQLIQDYPAIERAEKELRFIEKYRIDTLFISDPDYPKRLRNCYDAPVMLYYKGVSCLNAAKVISVVGTRNSTEYGRDLCRNLLADLKVHNPLIISGMAYGIDFAAHKESLKNSLLTVGIMAHGLDRIYPAQHRQMAEKMLGCGGILTEFMSGTVPDRENFPKRNRIIAGLSDVTIVVEAGIRGGALITAELANSYNRDVFAFPGRVGDEYSLGCNHLIKTNRANLLSGVADLEYLLGWGDSTRQNADIQLSMPVELTEDERIITGILHNRGHVAIDDLAVLTGFPQSRLVIRMLELEMKGMVIALPGKAYKLS